jgi:hypothetical protein
MSFTTDSSAVLTGRPQLLVKLWGVSINRQTNKQTATEKSLYQHFTDEEYRMALHYRYMLPQPIIPYGTRCTAYPGPAGASRYDGL